MEEVVLVLEVVEVHIPVRPLELLTVKEAMLRLSLCKGYLFWLLPVEGALCCFRRGEELGEKAVRL